ncbi:MAG: leucine-rich repeat domain-containing protein, partial [Kiritimatiellae bacterium]|nr:leucine-rich repeat domain-containing protein [Kiritimatiellia bacterium]
MRLFSARSSALLALAIAPVLARADTQFVDGVWTYKYDEYLSNPDPRIEIVKASTSVSGDVVVPSTLGGYPVVSLGAESFYRCSSMTSVTIPDCVTSIGDDAFRKCTALTNVVIGSGVASIGEYAFSTCANLATVYLPASYEGSTDNRFPDNATIVIYGAPEPVQVTVSFDANGAEGDVPDAIVCEEGSTVTLPDAENLTWANRSFA